MVAKSVTPPEYFERVEARKSRCRLCGLVLDHAGGRPRLHLRDHHPEAVLALDAAKGGGAPTEIPENPEELSPEDVRQKTLDFMHTIMSRADTPANARVAAARLISDIERLQDLDREEDEDEAEGKVVVRWEKAIVKKKDLEEEFRSALRDPATLARVERLCAEVRATL